MIHSTDCLSTDEVLTKIFVTISKHDFFVYSEYMTARKTIHPTSSGQIKYRRHLRVGLILVALGTISSVEANL